jgi:hypothetical protein
MDVQYPYAEGPARRQLMYRLPLPAGPQSLLLVEGPGAPSGLHEGWSGAVQRVDGESWLAASSTAQTAFDVVALPGAWDLGAGVAAPDLLKRANAALAPGGVVVGHADHLLALRRLATPAGWWQAWRSPVASVRACRRVLQAAGFKQVSCFHVQPSLDDPMGLIPDDRAASRAQFLRAVRAEQGHFSAPAYAARVLLAQLGLGGLQQLQLFFWARKPC